VKFERKCEEVARTVSLII